MNRSVDHRLAIPHVGASLACVPKVLNKSTHFGSWHCREPACDVSSYSLRDYSSVVRAFCHPHNTPRRDAPAPLLLSVARSVAIGLAFVALTEPALRELDLYGLPSPWFRRQGCFHQRR